MISHELKTIFIHIPRTGGTSIEWAMVGQNWFQIDPETKHIDWQQAKAIYGDYWNDYYKFTVVRNPWDWMVSLYHTHERGETKSWEDYLRAPNLNPNEQKKIVQSDIIGAEMDMVLRFEHLNRDFECLCKRLYTQRKLKHHKKGPTNKAHYSTFYNRHNRQLVAKRFESDIQRFGYEFSIPLIIKLLKLRQKVFR